MSDDYKVGDKVLFGRTHGEQTLGTVVKLGRSKLKVRQDESRGSMRSYTVGTVWAVPPSLCRKVGGVAPTVVAVTKRPEHEILRDIKNCYLGLSPENLWMDGEATREEATRRGTALRSRLRLLFVEIGRKVTEDEAYDVAPLSEFFQRQMAR